MSKHLPDLFEKDKSIVIISEKLISFVVTSPIPVKNCRMFTVLKEKPLF